MRRVNGNTYSLEMSYMHLPGQGKVQGIDTEVLGDNVKKKAQFDTSHTYT